MIDLETHQEIFQKILEILVNENCVQGQTLGVDATTLEANAANPLSGVARERRTSGFLSNWPCTHRRRIRGKRGKSLQRKWGEMVERTFAHGLETGGMRRVYLRGLVNVTKRYLIHVGGLNLGVMMRSKFKLGMPRGWGDAIQELPTESIPDFGCG